jgi:hypothetical protein
MSLGLTSNIGVFPQQSLEFLSQINLDLPLLPRDIYNHNAAIR